MKARTETRDRDQERRARRAELIRRLTVKMLEDGRPDSIWAEMLTDAIANKAK